MFILMIVGLFGLLFLGVVVIQSYPIPTIIVLICIVIWLFYSLCKDSYREYKEESKLKQGD